MFLIIILKYIHYFTWNK